MFGGPGPLGGFFGGLLQFLGFVVQAAAVLVVALVLAGVVVLLVRYLLVATRAHERYLELNPAPTRGSEPED